MLIIDTLAETWRVDNGQCDPGSILLLQLDVMLGDTYRVLLVSSSSGLSDGGRVEARVGVFGVLVEGSGTVGEERLVNEGVDKGGSSTARGACKSATRRLGFILADGQEGLKQVTQGRTRSEVQAQGQWASEG
jgi:hypothetical protein